MIPSWLLPCCLAALLATVAGAAELLRIDYYVWTRHAAAWPPADARAIRALDVLIFFKADGPDANGRMSLSAAAVAHLAQLKAITNPQTELWLGVGDLGPLVGQSAKLRGFLDSVRELSQTHGFKGLDIDWEDAAVTSANYADVVGAISDALRHGGFRLSTGIGTAPHYKTKAAAVKAKLDWTNIQFYYSVRNAWTVEQMAAELQTFVDAGVPPAGIAIGLPVYGMQDMSAYQTGSATTIGYRLMLNQGASAAANAWTHPTTGLTYLYSGLPLIRSKVRHALAGGYRGVFTWELTLDAAYGSSTSIERAIDLELTSDGDRDGDGMPDRWELEHGVDPTEQADGVGDCDGDGCSNQAEYLAGTDPQNSGSVFALALEPPAATVGGTGTLRWFGQPERFYRVYQSTDLNRWEPLGGVLAGHSQSLSAEVPLANVPGFFRCAVGLSEF